MSQDNFLKVHHLTLDPNTGEERVRQTTPYIALKNGERPPIILKGGQICDINGNLVDQVPWILKAAALCTDRALREAGFDPEELRSRVAGDVQNMNTQLDDPRDPIDEPEQPAPVQTRRGQVNPRLGARS